MSMKTEKRKKWYVSRVGLELKIFCLCCYPLHKALNYIVLWLGPSIVNILKLKVKIITGARAVLKILLALRLHKDVKNYCIKPVPSAMTHGQLDRHKQKFT